MRRLGSRVGGRDNNFALIRLLAALAVLFSHSFQVATGAASAQPLFRQTGTTLGSLAVDVFFVTSGFLVTASLVRTRGVADFARSRVLRVLPGLVVVVLLTTLAVAVSVPEGPRAFLGEPTTWQYVVQNIVLVPLSHSDSFPHVLGDAPAGAVVNGSLWTLAYEARLYVLMALVGLAMALPQRWGRPVRPAGPAARGRTLGRVAPVAVVVVVLGDVVAGDPTRITTGWDLAAMFFMGATLHTRRDRVPVGRPMLLGAAALLALGLAVGPAAPEVRSLATLLALPYLVVHLAYVPAGRVRAADRALGRAGDASYGVYLYAWPLQQLGVVLVPGIGPWALLVPTVPAALLLGFASWHLVERPCSGFMRRRRVGVGGLEVQPA